MILGSMSCTLTPLMRIVPFVGVSKPNNNCIIVDLPPPEGPAIPRKSPSSMCHVISFNT